MNSEEIDKIIAEAIAQDKGRKPRNSRATIDKVRKVLNVLFMLGFLAAVIIYFVMPADRALFFYVGFGAMFLKIVEFLLRFLF